MFVPVLSGVLGQTTRCPCGFSAYGVFIQYTKTLRDLLYNLKSQGNENCSGELDGTAQVSCEFGKILEAVMLLLLLLCSAM